MEALFVTPLFFFLVFALIDGSWVLYGDHVVRGSAAAGVRSASALANDTDADFRAIEAVRSNIDSIGRDKLVRIVVYRADKFGDDPPDGCKTGTPIPGTCNVYDGADLARPIEDFGCVGSAPDRFWCPTARRTATTGPMSPPDYIGVWIQARHVPLIGMIVGGERFVTHQSVLRIEPRTFE